MKNAGIEVSLMAGEKTPNCVEGKTHNWREDVKPPNSQSGWHEDLCINCGVRIMYDTSD